MSIRTTLLTTARAARTALPKAQVAPRRAASGAAHKPSSNTPWAIGSAAVFGSLAAFILMPAGEKAAHDVHESIDAKGAGAHVASGADKPEHEDEHHDKARELMRKERASGDRPTLDDDPKGKMVHAGEDRPRTEIPSKRDDEKPMRRGASTGANFDGTIDGKKMLSGIANEGTEEQNASVKSSPGVGAGSKKQTSTISTPDNVDDSDKPSGESIKDSVKQAAAAAVPKAKEAMDKVSDKVSSASDKVSDKVSNAADKASDAASKATSSDSSSSKSAPSTSSSSDTPSNVDDSDKPSDKEIVDSIHQAEHVAAPLATMQEEVDQSRRV